METEPVIIDATACEATRGFTDELVENRVNSERDKFIKKIRLKEVLKVASSHRGGMPCEIFKDAVVGTWNICYFVQFFEDGDRWVVRVPLLPCLGTGGRDKVESEVAAMQLVAERTSIPLPTLHGYKLGSDNLREPLNNYIVMDYVDARPASTVDLTLLTKHQQERFYSSLADIYIQLRRLEFPCLGRLVRTREGYDVRKPPNSIDINRQILEGTDPMAIIHEYGDKGVLRSADQYTGLMMELADNGFINSRSIVENVDRGANILYHHQEFRMHVFDKFWEGRHDRRPFVLEHGDLQPHNLLVNSKMEIVAVLGWDWSKVVPVRFFPAPLFLTNTDPEDMSSEEDYEQYLKTFAKFHAVLRTREWAKYVERTLSDEEWWRFRSAGGFLIANAITNWTEWHAFAMYFLTGRCQETVIALIPSINVFMQEAECRQIVVNTMCDDNDEYKKELRRFKINEAKARLVVPRRVRVRAVASSLLCRPRAA